MEYFSDKEIFVTEGEGVFFFLIPFFRWSFVFFLRPGINIVKKFLNYSLKLIESFFLLCLKRRLL